MAALPQVYATESDLASSGSLSDSGKVSSAASSPGVTLSAAIPYQTQNNLSLSKTQGLEQASPSPSFSASSPLSATSSSLSSPLSPSSISVQRPQTGISSVPKFEQRVWRAILDRGAFQYKGNTFQASMNQHLPTQISSNYAAGPQHVEHTGGTLPDAEHRQAWATQPTFRWFKRSDYDGVRDRWSARGSQTSRGDNLYRPYSVAEQNTINLRVERRKLARGDPRRGEW